MYTISADSIIDKELIESVIEYNEDKKGHYDKLERYYLGDHDILSRIKVENLANNRVVINHAKYITDVNVGYLLGNPIEYQAKDKTNIDDILEEYKKQTISDLDHEIAKDISKFGTQYEYIYANQENEIHSEEIDVRNCIVVYDDSIEHNKLFAVIYKLGATEKTYDFVEVINERSIITFAHAGKLEWIEDRPHFFGAVPVIEYRNNGEHQGDYEQVISLIDAYNLLQSDRVNDKEQLVEAILVIYGCELEDEQADSLKVNRILAGLPEGGKAEYLIKQLDEEKTDVLRRTLEADIHKISMTPNMSDEKFVGNSSGVAIKYKLLAFEQAILGKERYFEKGLMERFSLYNTYLANLGTMPLIPIYQIDALFKRNLPQNDYETSQMILNLEGYITRETAVGQLSFVDDAKEETESAEKEEEKRFNKESKMFGTDKPNEDEEEK